MDKCADCEFFVQFGDIWDCSASACPYEDEYNVLENTEENYPNIDDI